LTTRRNEMAISEAELSAMTGNLDQLHHDVARPALREGIVRWGAPTSRRAFLLGAGVLAGGAALAACGAGSGRSPGAVALSGDLAVASRAASLENLAVYVYKSGLAAATAGHLGAVPPAVLTFARTAMGQHRDHAGAWNAILAGAGQASVTTTDAKLMPTVNRQFAKVTDITGLASLALQIENIAAQTYQVQTAKLGAQKAIALSASIMPVEMQHAAILYFMLGQYPGIQDVNGTPLAFSPTSLAA
jgi:hypothetical protein